MAPNIGRPVTQSTHRSATNMMELAQVPTKQQLAAQASNLAEARDKAGVVLKELQTQLSDELNDMRLGATGAQERADAVKSRLAEAEKELQLTTAAALKADEVLARQHRHEEQEAELARQRSIPALARKHSNEAELIDVLAAQMGAAMNEHAATSAELAKAVGTPEASRAFSQGAVADRFRYCLARHFEQPGNRPPADVATRGPDLPFRWLPWQINPGSPEFRMTLAGKLRTVMDDCVRVFASEDEARAAIDRLGSNGRLFAIPGPAGLFHLVVGKLRGAARLAKSKGVSV